MNKNNYLRKLIRTITSILSVDKNRAGKCIDCGACCKLPNFALASETFLEFIGKIREYEYWLPEIEEFRKKHDNKIGGFLGRKSDGEPGWQTLWKGEMILMLLVEGARMALSGGVTYG